MNMIASQPIISCTSSSFSNPNISDASVLSLSAFLVQNYTASSPPFYNPNHGTITPVTLDFCNVTITHTHPGANDIVETQIWLPTSTWNERLQVVGGGGYIAGLFGYMFVAMDGALAEGYATASTNAGIYATDINGGDAHEWALLPNGSINLPLIKNFAYVSLGDMSVIAKSIVKSYYGSKEKYSYFSGCSNGGRQGYQLAQRYPKAFDGIAACAPGIYWDEWVENFWAQQLMSSEASYPHGCELDALHQAAVEACDELGDGVKDGIMSEPDLCDFDPYLMVGKSVECPDAGHNVKVSKIAAQIAQSVWKNQRQPGINFQGQPAGYDVDLKYAGGTTCSPNSTCIGNPDLLTLNYIRTFVKKDTSWDPSGMTREELENLRAQSVREYKDILGITSYELSAFRDNGGKMITYQGTVSPLSGSVLCCVANVLHSLIQRSRTKTRVAFTTQSTNKTTLFMNTTDFSWLLDWVMGLVAKEHILIQLSMHWLIG